MAAIITSSIPKQNFERIRDQIAVLLLLELHNQYLINNTYPNITKVWLERWIPYNSPTQLPTINVNMQQAIYNSKSGPRMTGAYTYNIDIYTCAVSSVANGPGDQYAMILMQKIAGLIRSILAAPAYNNLGFEAGVVTTSMVEGFAIGDKGDVKDALSDVIGRLRFTVGSVESDIITAVPVPLLQSNTHVKLEESEEGFYYQLNTAA